MTELVLTPEQKIEQEIQESEVTIKMTIGGAQAVLGLLAKLPYSEVEGVISNLFAQLAPQGKEIRTAVTAKHAAKAELEAEKAADTAE